MRIRKVFSAFASAVLALQLLCVNLPAQSIPGNVTNIAVAPQYDTTHVYVTLDDFDRFVASLVATFGGTTSKQGVITVTPISSSTMSQLVLTPVGTLSVFGFKTPIPYPFGSERTGYLVADMDTAIQAARTTSADVDVAPFNDPVGRDPIIQCPGGCAIPGRIHCRDSLDHRQTKLMLNEHLDAIISHAGGSYIAPHTKPCSGPVRISGHSGRA